MGGEQTKGDKALMCLIKTDTDLCPIRPGIRRESKDDIECFCYRDKREHELLEIEGE